jgi:hypothetical protein
MIDLVCLAHYSCKGHGCFTTKTYTNGRGNEFLTILVHDWKGFFSSNVHYSLALNCASCNAIRCKKCLNKLLWKMWFAIGATNSKPNEYEHWVTKCTKTMVIFLVAFKICIQFIM